DKGESPREAVIREVREEAGVIVQENPVIFECYFNIYGGVDDIVSLYIIKKFQIQKIKSKEIAEVKWFPINRLPENASKATKRRIAEIFFNLEKSERW
ncbi:NUDIX domain-containing protein, partial [Silvanigrella sp.]